MDKYSTLPKYRIARAGIWRVGEHTMVGPNEQGKLGNIVHEAMFTVREWDAMIRKGDVKPIDAPDTGDTEKVKSLTDHIADLEDACNALNAQVQDQEELVVEKQFTIDTHTDEVKQLQKPVKKTKKKDK